MAVESTLPAQQQLSTRPAASIAIEQFNEFSTDASEGSPRTDSAGWSAGWKLASNVPAQIHESRLARHAQADSDEESNAVLIQGTKGRNNPLRRELSKPYAGTELFVRYLIRYDAASIDRAPQSDGEFFVMWLDGADGGDAATHSSGVPNIGLHVDSANDSKNAFMTRFSPTTTSFSDVELEGDRTYLVVARLSKSRDADGTFDELSLWIDPQPAKPGLPVAGSFHTSRLKSIRWVGFSTGRKTETSDQIWIDDLVLADSWEGLFELPSNSVTFPDPPSVLEELLAQEKEIPPELRPARMIPENPTVSFRKDVYSILKSRCLGCHEGANPDSGYRLDLLAELLGETNGEPQVVPGHADVSNLIRVVTAGDSSKLRMPPVKTGSRLAMREIQTLKSWINEGVAWDDELLPPVSPTSDHWAFQRIERPVVPEVRASLLKIRTPIDAFVTNRHSKHKLQPAPEADTNTLVRRAWLDLCGLPPSYSDDTLPADTEFVDDSSWRQFVDRLLDLQAYGERWGRHWLDVARWAESNGYQHNRDRPHAWRYRDYVVDSFNEDKPFDQFLTEQIAGDELEPYSDENVIATGFLSAAQYSGNEKDKSLQRYDILVDVVNATGKAFLGLTFECAQCHNHKFDPVSARDYYRFQAFFSKAQPVNVILPQTSGRKASHSDPDNDFQVLCQERQAIFDATHARVYASERRKRPEGDIFVLPKTVVARMRAPERKRYDELGRQLNALPQAWAFYSPVTAARDLAAPPLEMRWPLRLDKELLASRQQRLYVKGDARRPGPVVTPGWPALFGTVPTSVSESTRPRTELARWLTSRDNPLTARVWVNRIWQHHFGHGLVEESGNFGLTTPQPEYIGLLDWLAVELMENNWSTKHIHRLILNSSVWRMSSRFDEQNSVIDPDNRFLWRWTPRRLEAEAVRDCILAVTGELSEEAGGPSVRTDSPDATKRRSVYLHQKRNGMPGMQNLFDGPSSLISCSIRRVSTVPLQPLFLLNSSFMQARARRFAGRAAVASSASDERDIVEGEEAAIRRIFRLALNRPPTPDEMKKSLEFIRSTDNREQALEQFCHAVLNLNEFAYIP